MTESKQGKGAAYRREAADGVTIRTAVAADVAGVVRIDERNTGLAKPGYWEDTFERYGARSSRFFLVAERGGQVAGYILGEIRAWEFGSPPCGWIFAIGVDRDVRLERLGTRLFDAMVECLGAAGATKLRTMVAVEDGLNLSFFRSQGMRGGPFIELEMEVNANGEGGA